MECWWTTRCCLVTDDDPWARRFLAASDGLEVELLPWGRVARVPDEPLAVLVADTGRSSWREVSKLFETWASQALQPCVVVRQRPLAESVRFRAELGKLGYDRVVRGLDPGASAATAAEEAVAVGDLSMWTVPPFARALRATEPDAVTALATVAASPEAIRTVREWARRTGLVGWELRKTFRARNIPAPKRVLDRLRLSLAVVHAATEVRRLTRNDLARRVGYASGRYLGRCAKRIAGRPLSALRKEPPLKVIRDLAVSARRA